MIMENQLLLMILNTLIRKENKTLMDILMVGLSMKNVEMMVKMLLMVILMVMLSMIKSNIILQPK
jgi:hypothetical protein